MARAEEFLACCRRFSAKRLPSETLKTADVSYTLSSVTLFENDPAQEVIAADFAKLESETSSDEDCVHLI